MERAIDSRKPVMENDVSQVPGHRRRFRETVAAVCLPLVSFRQVLKVLVLENASCEAFAPADVNALESVSDICAAAIQNARYFDRVRQLAYMDGVTGIFQPTLFRAAPGRRDRARQPPRPGPLRGHGRHRPLQAAQR